MSVEQWAFFEKKNVLAISRDNDWKEFCEKSKVMTFNNDLGKGLSYFHTSSLASETLSALSIKLGNGTATDLIKNISNKLDYIFSDHTPEIEAESTFHWQIEETSILFKSLKFPINKDGEVEFYTINIDNENSEFTIEIDAEIVTELSVDYSLSIDTDSSVFTSLNKTLKETNIYELLLKFSGNLSNGIDTIKILDVEITNGLYWWINFGSLEP